MPRGTEITKRSIAEMPAMRPVLDFLGGVAMTGEFCSTSSGPTELPGWSSCD